MATNKVTFIIEAVGKGLEKAKKDAAEIGKNARASGEGFAQANKSAGGFYNTQQKGVIGTANSTKSFSKLAETMGSGGGGLVGAYATLAANVFAVTAAFGALRSAARVEQVQAGLTAMSNRMGTTLSVAANNLREISDFTLTVEQSLRSTAQISAAGFGTKSIGQLGQVAKDTSRALGRDMTDSMDRLTRGVVKLEPELLDELGLMTKIGESSARYAAQLGKSESQLSNFEKRQGFLNAIVAEGTAKFGGLSDSMGNLTNLDRLAATFSDLTKEIFTFLNKGALPLAALFSNKGVLLGGMLLFASTISKQLLPGLSNLSIKSAQAAAELTQIASAQVTAVPTAKSEPKAMKALRRDIKDGKADVDSYSRALEGLKAKEESLQKIYDNGGTQRTRYGAERLAGVADEIEILESQQVAVRRTMLLEQQADARRLGASAIVAAGNKNVATSYFLASAAVKQYHASVMAATAGTAGLGATAAKSMAIARTAFFAASIGVRAFGAAVTSALGTIGLVVTVVYALYEGFKFLINQMADPKVELAKKAFKEQETILGQLGERYTEVTRVAKSNIPVSQKQLQIYKTMTNTVRENIEAFEKSAIAENAANMKKSNVRAGDSAAFKTLNDLRNSGLPEVRKQIDEALGTRGLGKVLDNADAMLSKSQLASMAELITGDLRGGAVTLGDHINDVTDASKEAGKAISEFNRSMVPSTPYDAVALQLNGVATSMANVIGNSTGSNSMSARIAQTISGIDAGVTGFFSAGLQQDLAKFKEFDQIANDTAGKMDAYSLKANRNAKYQKGLLQESIALRSSEVFKVQELFAEAQKVSIETKALVSMEEARLKRLNSFKALSGSTIKLRIESENRIISLQLNQIKGQINIVKQQQEMLRIQKAFNEASIASVSTYASLAAAIGDAGVRNQERLSTEIAVRNQALAAEKAAKGTTAARKIEIQEELAGNQKILGLVTTVASQNLALRGADAQINAANIESQSLQLGQTSELVANAEAVSQNKKTESERAQKALEIAKSQVNIEQVRLDIARKLEGRSATLADQYNDIARAQQKTLTAEKASIGAAAVSTTKDLMVDRQRAFEQGLTTEVALYDRRIQQEFTVANLRMQELDAQAQSALLEKVSFDTQSEGINMQKDALSYYEKFLETQSEIVAQQREGAKLDREISRRRRGAASNEFDDKNEEIRAAKTALESAKAEAGVRKSVITLEYALLDAKRQQALMDLNTQKTILAAQGKLTANMVSQIDSTLSLLENGAGVFTDARDNALRSVDENVNNLARQLKIVSMNEGKNNRGVDILNSIRENRTLRAGAGRQADATMGAEAKAANLAIVPFERAASPIVNALTENSRITAQQTDIMKTQIEATQVATQTNVAAGPALSGALYDRLKTFKEWVEKTYPGVRGELDNHGGATGDRRAIDFNIGERGSVEWNNTQRKAIFNAIAAAAREQGLGTLWGPGGSEFNKRGVGGHKDHLHVDGKADGARGTSSVAALAPPIKVLGAAITKLDGTLQTTLPELAAAPSAVAANDNSPEAAISVTGTRAAPIKNLKDALEELNGSMAMADFSMLSTFQEMADKLGPGGTIVTSIMAGVQTIGDSIVSFQEVLNRSDTYNEAGELITTAASLGEKIQAGAAIAMQSVSMISSVMNAASDTRIQGIDREIAAEQKRDGKSAESVAKIQALEKKKDGMARKSFNMNKKLMMAQAVISTAAAVAGQLAAPPVGPWNIALAAMMGAFGAAQLAIISGTQYQSSSSANFEAKSMPSTLSIGKRGDGVDVAKSNPNLGGELGYLRGSRGTGTNSSNYSTIGSAYGGPMPRGYGNSAFVVGEKGPEIIERDTPVSIRPMNDNQPGSLANATFNISAFDGESVHEMLNNRKGDIIDMLREAANANGSRFMEDVNTSHYKKAGAGGGRRI